MSLHLKADTTRTECSTSSKIAMPRGREAESAASEVWEMIADNLSKAGWSWGLRGDFRIDIRWEIETTGGAMNKVILLIVAIQSASIALAAEDIKFAVYAPKTDIS